MADEKECKTESLEDVSDEIELFDPWSKELAFEKARPLPLPADLSQDLVDTIH